MCAAASNKIGGIMKHGIIAIFWNILALIILPLNTAFGDTDGWKEAARLSSTLR